MIPDFPPKSRNFSETIVTTTAHAKRATRYPDAESDES